jgi:hypothetical protein
MFSQATVSASGGWSVRPAAGYPAFQQQAAQSHAAFLTAESTLTGVSPRTAQGIHAISQRLSDPGIQVVCFSCSTAWRSHSF